MVATGRCRVDYAERALSDLERLHTFLARADPRAAAASIARITSAVEALHDHPLIGRPVEAGLRELVISRGKTGYVALYRYDEAKDGVLLLCIRHQREAGYA